MGFLSLNSAGNIAQKIGRGAGLAAKAIGRGARLVGRASQVAAKALRSPTGQAIRSVVKEIPVVGKFAELAARGVERVSDISAQAERSVSGVRAAVQSGRESAMNIRRTLASGQGISSGDIRNVIMSGKQSIQQVQDFQQSLQPVSA